MNAKALMDFTYIDWIKKNTAAIEYLKKEKEGRSIILVGHSLGGTICLINASERDDITGIVTIGTPTRFPIVSHILGILASKVIKKINMKYDDFYFEDERLFENPYFEFLVENYGKVSYYIIGEVLKAIGKSYRILDKISIPSLIIASPKDNAIPKRSAFDLYSKIGSDKKEVKYYDNAYHMLIADASKEEVADKILSFVKSL
jgi:carboxylesterase